LREALVSRCRPDQGGVFVCRITSSGMEQDDPPGEDGALARDLDRPGPDWARIEHAYIHGDWSLGRIADAYGSSPTTITAHARKGGWVRLIGTKPLPCGRRARPPGAPRSKRATIDQVRRRTMVRRLLGVLDGKLKELEDRMAEAQGEAPQSAADIERDARSLTALARLYAKLVELDNAAKGEAEGSNQGDAVRSEDADQLRRDLARRLERLGQAGNV
jgi:hypothetical protein